MYKFGRYAPVAPTSLLLQLRDAGLLGEYHLVLAHDVVKYWKEYGDLFGSYWRAQAKHPFVILDNSVIELGEPVSLEILQEAAEIVKPDCVVLPDMLDECDETIHLSLEAAQAWKNKLDFPLMAVIQGKTLQEYFDCFRALHECAEIEYWGIPRKAVMHLGTRQSLVSMVQSLIVRNPPKIHLLGSSVNFMDDIACARRDGVMGFDSAAPVILGQQGKHISLDRMVKHPGRPDDYWAQNQLAPEAKTNIQMINRWLEIN